MDNLTVIGRAEEVPADPDSHVTSKAGDMIGLLIHKESNKDTTVTFNFAQYPYSLYGRGFVICFKRKNKLKHNLLPYSKEPELDHVV